MKFMGDLMGGNLPVARHMPIYDAAQLQYGELLMLGATDPDTGDDEGCALITAYTATQNTQAVDAVGMLSENTYATGGTTPGGDFSPTTGNIANQLYYGAVVTNPFARYYTPYKAGAAYDDPITSTSGTTLTIPSAGDDVHAGSWKYFPLTQAGVQYYLRYIVADASGSMTMDSALVADGDTNDTVIHIERINNYPADLSDDGLGLSSDDYAGNENGADNFLILENFVQDNFSREPQALGMHPTRGVDRRHGVNHRAQGPMHDSTRFYAEMILLDRLYSPGD